MLLAKTVWANIGGMLTRNHSNAPADLTEVAQPRRLPPEIVEMIIANLRYDVPALKSCTATCFAWHEITRPHLHRTLRFPSLFFDVPRERQGKDPGSLPSLLELGLLPLVKQLEFDGSARIKHATFTSHKMRYFHAMENLQELRIANLDFSEFPKFEKYLGHFAPTLRSIALSRPNGACRDLLDFLRLFPKLDDIEILYYRCRLETPRPLDDKLVPITGGLRGHLTLHMFSDEGLLKDMVVVFGGLRFTSMDLKHAQGIPFILKACAETLETLCVHPVDVACKRVPFR